MKWGSICGGGTAILVFLGYLWTPAKSVADSDAPPYYDQKHVDDKIDGLRTEFASVLTPLAAQVQITSQQASSAAIDLNRNRRRSVESDIRQLQDDIKSTSNPAARARLQVDLQREQQQDLPQIDTEYTVLLQLQKQQIKDLQLQVRKPRRGK